MFGGFAITGGIGLKALVRTCVLLALASASTYAFANTGTSGVVTDPQGKAVSGAIIRLFHITGALVVETSTDDNGGFTIASLPSGDYRITASAPGFTTITQDLALIADQKHHGGAAIRLRSRAISERRHNR